MKHIFKPYPFKTIKYSTKDYAYIVMGQNNNILYREKITGEWIKVEYDDKGNEIYWETSEGNWIKREYGEDGYQNYYETSSGLKINRKP